jgi:hypothetical protein
MAIEVQAMAREIPNFSGSLREDPSLHVFAENYTRELHNLFSRKIY